MNNTGLGCPINTAELRKVTSRIATRLGLKGSSVSKQTRHLPYNHPSMCAVRNWVGMMVETKAVEPKLLCHFDQVWTTHYEAARRVLFKPIEKSGVVPGEKMKPTDEKLMASIRDALELSIRGPDAGVKKKQDGPQQPELNAQSTLIPVEYQRNARTTTTLSFADGSLGRAYITASQSVLSESQFPLQYRAEQCTHS